MEEKPGLSVRKAATKLLSAIVDKRTSMDGLLDVNGGNPAFTQLGDKDRLLVKAMLLATLRNFQTIDAFIHQLLDRPLPQGATSLRHILRIAAVQILFLDVPDHSAVDLAVEQASQDPRNKRFANLCNALLRKMSRLKEKRLPNLQARITNLPDWYFERIVTHYGPDRAQIIVDMLAKPAPTDITVKDKADYWAEQMGGVVLTENSIRLTKLNGPVQALPGFDDGQWWVQDVAASIPARLFGDLAGKRVVDLCAAPGGKTAQLIMAGADVTALDRSKTRLKRLDENLKRLNLSANLQQSKMEDYQTDELFDAALLDAPCSSTGTIRRHPDIVWTKSSDDIAYLANVQKALIEHAITLLKPGGLLVFSNCSLDPEEGEMLMDQILEEMAGHIELVPISPENCLGFEGAITPKGTLRTTPEFMVSNDPSKKGADGFFAALIKKL